MIRYPFRSTRAPVQHRRPCPIPCPPFDIAAVWALLDSAGDSPWWQTWSAALFISTLARLLCRRLRRRTDTTVRPPEADQKSSSAPATPSTSVESDPTDA